MRQTEFPSATKVFGKFRKLSVFWINLICTVGISASNRWVLRGLIVLIRHGDRGPLQHIKNISNVNCGGISSSPLLNSYKVITVEIECISSVVG